MSVDLDQQAINILQQNDRGGFTIPTARLYPYQWNWDSAFVALGFATFDTDRAWCELELLLEGQWKNGMIPHILFRQNDPDYFPGPSVWQTPTTEGGGGIMPSGGISQPPVLASIVRTLLQKTGDRKRTAQFIDPLMRWHRWFHECRTPNGLDTIATVHPWESGRDNCPDWEIGLSNMSIDPDIEPYERMDTLHSSALQRPSKEQYDKYLTIIKFGRDHGWDQKVLTQRGPFLVADPGLHFILLRADRDLLTIVKEFGRNDYVAEVEAWIAKGVSGTDFFWNAAIRSFCARDVRTGRFSDGFSSASALCFYADTGTDEQRAGTLDNIRRIQSKVQFMLPSWDPDHPMFEKQRYWCGPLWPQMNYIVSAGLAEQGEQELAEKIRRDLGTVIEQSGFFECFDPITGDGCLGTEFSWTAAIWLASVSPHHRAVAA